jgi:spore germination cell wall hydrolase CwlJ-like protein
VANGLPEDANSIATWLAKVRAETAKPDGRRNGRKAADAGGRQKVSKGARQRQNKPKTARAQAQAEEQEALASIVEAEVEVEPSFEGPENEWGDPKMMW